jgi:hypothetical protein
VRSNSYCWPPVAHKYTCNAQRKAKGNLNLCRCTYMHPCTPPSRPPPPPSPLVSLRTYCCRDRERAVFPLMLQPVFTHLVAGALQCRSTHTAPPGRTSSSIKFPSLHFAAHTISSLSSPSLQKPAGALPPPSCVHHGEMSSMEADPRD